MVIIKRLSNHSYKYKNKLPVCTINPGFNRTIEDLGKEFKNYILFKTDYQRKCKVTEEGLKYEFIMTHTARRSFCTHMYLLCTSVNDHVR